MFNLFGAPNKKVTPREFKNDIRGKLKSKGLSHRDVEIVEGYAMGSLDEIGRSRGMDGREVAQLVDTLKKNKSSHSLSDRQIGIVNDVFTEEL